MTTLGKPICPAGEGSLNIEMRLRRALSAAIKQCRLSGTQLAEEMRHLLGEPITVDMIYSWTAKSKTKHQIWGSRLPAFCLVTGDRRPLEILAESIGLFIMTGPEVQRAEIQRLDEQVKEIMTQKRKLEMFLQEIEK